MDAIGKKTKKGRKERHHWPESIHPSIHLSLTKATWCFLGGESPQRITSTHCVRSRSIRATSWQSYFSFLYFFTKTSLFVLPGEINVYCWFWSHQTAVMYVPRFFFFLSWWTACKMYTLCLSVWYIISLPSDLPPPVFVIREPLGSDVEKLKMK